MNTKQVLSRYEAAVEYFGGVLTRFDDAKNAGHLKTYKLGRKVMTTRAHCESCIAYQQKMSEKGKPCVYRARPAERRASP